MACAMGTKISFNETFVTAQRIGGKITPCRFIQIEELRDFVNDEGYQLAFQNRAEEDLASQIGPAIDHQYRNVASINFFFARRKNR